MKTPVIFRKDKKTRDIYALFPYEIADNKGHCLCYQHIGQHSAADYTGCIAASFPALPEEYASLASELKSIGYELQIIKRKARNR